MCNAWRSAGLNCRFKSPNNGTVRGKNLLHNGEESDEEIRLILEKAVNKFAALFLK
jgi:hypothetical protein